MIRIGEVGYKSNGVPAVFLWCRAHRYVHACTLDQMLSYFYVLSDGDTKLRQNYTIALNRALSELNEHDTMGKKQESA